MYHSLVSQLNLLDVVDVQSHSCPEIDLISPTMPHTYTLTYLTTDQPPRKMDEPDQYFCPIEKLARPSDPPSRPR